MKWQNFKDPDVSDTLNVGGQETWETQHTEQEVGHNSMIGHMHKWGKEDEVKH